MTDNSQQPIVTLSRITRDLKNLGLRPGDLIMLHSSVKAIGWVVGGPDVVLQAIIDLLGVKGTLMMLAGWEDNPYHLPEWPRGKQTAYLEECPPFDPATSRANRNWSILNEYLRTRPGAQRSSHPEGSFVALGHLARHITENQPWQYGYGTGSPLAKLCEGGGKVLLLGAPLNTITLLHYAEFLADVPNKRIVNYKMPVMQNGKRVWVELEEFDTSRGIIDWPGEDYFDAIGREYLSSGKGSSGKVGGAQSYLFDANDLVKFAIRWMERNFNGIK
ncbi:MAG: aminoglycoside 3-N-acetyltransferase [Dehalococcoidales bacterium]